MPGEGLQIPVDFTLEEARTALKQLEEAARQSGKKMQDGLAPATKEVGSFGAMLTKVARDQRGEGRIAAFYVQEMTAILPITGMAKMAVGELAQAFIGGAGLGAAIGLAVGSLKLLSEWYRTATEADRKFGEGVIQRAPQIVEAYKQMKIEAARFQAQLLGGAAGAAKFNAELRNQTATENVEKTRQELHQTFQVLDALEKKITLLKLQGRFNPIGQDASRLKEATEAYNAAKEAYKAALGTKGEAANLGAMELQAQLPQVGPQPATDSEVQAELGRRKAVADAAAKEAAAARKAELEKLQQEGLDELRAINQANEEEIRSSNETAMELLRAGAEAAEAQKQRALAAQQEALTGIFGVDAALNALEAESQQRLEHIRQLEEEGLITSGQAEIARTTIAEQQSEKRLALLRRETIQSRFFNEQMAKSGQALASSFVGEFGKMFRSSRAYEQAMREAGQSTAAAADFSVAAVAKMAQETLATFAEQALVEGLMETARGIAAAARYDYAAASQHFSAAAAFGVAGAAAGMGAALIGQTRGMTASERASVNSARSSAAGSDTTSSGLVPSTDSSGGYIGGAGTSSGTAYQREVVLVVGDPFETPAETARRVARRLKLAEQLNLIRRSA